MEPAARASIAGVGTAVTEGANGEANWQYISDRNMICIREGKEDGKQGERWDPRDAELIQVNQLEPSFI